jgi:hypothetical protein
MKRLAFLFSMCFVAVHVLAPVQAQPRVDSATIAFSEAGDRVLGTSTSLWDQWVYYPNTNWWNTWFYDHPLNFNRWKEFTLQMQVASTAPLVNPVFVEVALNWSTPLYTSTGAVGPPLPPIDPIQEQGFIGRSLVFSDVVMPGQLPSVTIVGRLPVPYNPEWVSIDVRPTVTANAIGLVELSFVLRHDCIPEPATLALAVLSVSMMISRRR